MSEPLALQSLLVRVGSRVLVGPIDLTARPGELTCVLGPNGSGKTSLLRAIAGLSSYEGRALLGDTDLRALPARTRATRVAYVPQRSLLDAALSVRSVVAQGRFAFGVHAQDDAIVSETLRKLDLQGLAARSFPTLSLGEQRRVLLARALSTGARCLLLDEPDAYLDVQQRLRLFALLASLRQERHTLLVVVHALDEALRHADRCALLHRAALVAYDTPQRALGASLLRAVFGVEASENGAPAFRLTDA